MGFWASSVMGWSQPCLVWRGGAGTMREVKIDREMPRISETGTRRHAASWTG